MSTINNKESTVRVTNTTESPHLIKRITQIAEFSVLTAEQTRFSKAEETALLSLVPKCDPDLTVYVKERTNENNTTKPSGLRQLKLLANLRITHQ